ncbi:MAG: hypothetical protein ACTHOH_02635 [Lysobacteraceae bacterium]
MDRLRIRVCLCACGALLLAAACSSSPAPAATTAAATVQHAASVPAMPGTDIEAAPRWPRTDIAERRFDGDRLFIEREGNTWRAWAVSSPAQGRARAMEFFTGAVIEGRLDADDRPPRHYMLTDDAGKPHRWLAEASFQPRPDPGDGNGAMYFGHGDIALGFGDTVFAGDPQGLCPLELHVVARKPGKDRTDISSAWAKVAMHHAPPDGDCPSGEWVSEVRSALDLRDGTFLAAIGDYIYRLHMADLSPVGQARSLRVIDASAASNIARRISAGKTEDPNGDFTPSLAASSAHLREPQPERKDSISPQALAAGEYATDHGWGRLLVTQVPGAKSRFQLATTNGEAICNVEGRVEGARGISDDSDGAEACTLHFTPVGNRISITTETRDTCRELCGVNGSFEGEYTRLPANCTRDAIAATRRKFRQAYDRRDYGVAVAALSPVFDQCIATADWEEEGDLRNDLALALHRAGRPSECLKRLEPYRADAKRRDDDIIADWPPALAERYLAIIKAARTNIRLCSPRH